MCVLYAVSSSTDRLISYHRYVETHTTATFAIRQALFNISVAEIEVKFMSHEFGDDGAVELEGCDLLLRVTYHSR